MSLLATKFDIVVDRSICCPGHGKSIVDAVNGVDKNTILKRSMRKVQTPDEALSSSSSSLQVHSFNNVAGGKAYSAAEDCKRILEMEGGGGVRAGVKREKRELNRGINERHWHVRKLSEKLNELKCATIKIPDPNLSFKDMYHHYTCKELGVGKAALRQYPCNCNACDEIIRLPWEPGKSAVEQPRFEMVVGCYFESVLEDSNKWFIVDVNLSEKGDEEDAGEAHEEVLRHVTSAVAQSIVVGAIGAIATSDEAAKDGYYIVEFTSLPFTDQSEGGTLKVEVNWLFQVEGARKWFTKSAIEDSFDVVNVVSTGVEMLPISPSNMPPKRAQKRAQKNEALKISEESHNLILDEIMRRDRLEYDPSRVFVGDEDEEDDEDEDDDDDEEEM